MSLPRRPDPGIYMVCDPRPGRAKAAVQAMVCASGDMDDRMLALDGPGFALLTASPPGSEYSRGPGVYCDHHGILAWAGEMCLPWAWYDRAGPASVRTTAAILRRNLVTRGLEVLAEIDGSFCGAWFDNETRKWTMFNDRWGLMPLFWWSRNDRLVVAPRARLAWQASNTQLSIDENGVVDLLRSQNMLDDHTLIADIHWLEPAHGLNWNGRRVDIHRYWSFEHKPVEPRSYDDVVQGYLDAARPTLAHMTDCQSPLLQGLSGGLDSRMFLALCDERGRAPTCFTSGLAYGEDVRFARQLAHVARTSHDSLLLDAREFPRQLRESIINTDGLHGAGHLVASTPINDYLSRHGGAVLLEGYLHGVLGGSDLPVDEDIPANVPAHQHAWALAFLHSGGTPEQIGGLLHEDIASASLTRWRSHVDDTFGSCPIDDPLYRAEYAIITGRSGRNDVLVPAMARRHVLARHLACDMRMIEWYAATPARLRRARQPYIDVLRRHFPAFARVPRADGCSGMPLSDEPWRREYAWQCEKLHTRWVWLRYADVRRWGRDSIAARAWGFETCRQAGLFEPLLAADARVLEWVRPHALRSSFEAACHQPRQAVPLLSLLTIEIMLRELESTKRIESLPTPGAEPPTLAASHSY